MSSSMETDERTQLIADYRKKIRDHMEVEAKLVSLTVFFHFVVLFLSSLILFSMIKLTSFIINDKSY